MFRLRQIHHQGGKLKEKYIYVYIDPGEITNISPSQCDTDATDGSFCLVFITVHRAYKI